MRNLIFGLGAVFAFSTNLIAGQATVIQSTAPQPTACINAKYTATGNQYWKNIVISLTNNCGKSVDFQNAAITYQNTVGLNINDVWGDFAPLSYPENLKLSTNAGVSTINLVFPGNSKLPDKSTINIRYGAALDGYVDGSLKVYVNDAVATGNIDLTASAKPATVSQAYALVNITLNGQVINAVELPWASKKTISGLAYGTYNLAPVAIVDSHGTKYQGTANPSTVSVANGTIAVSSITYSAVQQTGKITLKLGALPNELAGYSTNPSVLLTQAGVGSSVSQTVTWDNSVTVNQLEQDSTYNLSTPVINYNGYRCSPTFKPATIVASLTAPTATLSYLCAQIAQDNVSLVVKGAPAALTSLQVTLTPNDNSVAIKQTIDLNNGAGTSSVTLNEGSVYNVSADLVEGYSVTFTPQPLTASANSIETITFSPQSGGRIITYVPGWKTPPAAKDLASAGYTHVMVAFGVFSTSAPGNIAPAFDTVTKAYIQSLQDNGIKVILSLGGASTSIPNTTVDFHQVLVMASSPEVFKQTFMKSLHGLIQEYGFDGFDIDIEHGINGGGTFSSPQGDIEVMSSIINTMYAQNPNLLITLTPQVANISATRGFDGTWGNYASLVMQTHQSLAWVGIQLYNTGCAYGIDLICYDSNEPGANFSVAMAVDLLADWPAKLADGRGTGFQPYISYLKPSQIVLGYPAADSSGNSDGAPATPTSSIKKAIMCLKTGKTSCGTYLPPKAYGNIGGVFNWEATYDQNNQFRFAKDLKACVIDGNCN